MRLIVVRHGQTEENRKGIVQGNKSGDLSELGKRQVKNVATQLKNEQIDAIYSSDLQRCVDTVKPIYHYHQAVPLQFTSALREVNIGKLEGLHIFLPLFLVKRVVKLAMVFNIKAPGGESWKKTRVRVGVFLNQVYSLHANDTVLLVTHGFTTQAIISLLSNSQEKKLSGESVPNCVVYRLAMIETIVL